MDQNLKDDPCQSEKTIIHVGVTVNVLNTCLPLS